MSHFYGSMTGSRGEATRCGTPNSGISGHLRGWDIGCRVDVAVDSDGNDVVRVYATTGSGRSGNDVLIAEYTREDYDSGTIQTED